MKVFFATSDQAVGFLAAINLMVASVAKFFQTLAPAVDALVSLGQFAVAVVTVVYIWRKAQAVKRASEKAVETDEDSD
jgi:hypothetical protein